MMKQLYLLLAAMLLLCLAPMPYGYFVLVRFVAMVAFGAMALKYYQERKSELMWTCATLALLFQPFAKIALGRLIWNIVDVVVAIGLIVLFFIEKRGATPQQKPQKPSGAPELGAVDNEIEFSLKGRLAPRELIYVASEEDKELTELFETKPEVVEGWGKMIGFQIIYLPLLMKRLRAKEVLHYRAPYLSDMELEGLRLGNDYLLQYLDNPNDRKRIKQGFIRTVDIHRGGDGKDKASNRFYPLSSKCGESLGDQLHRIGKQITQEQTASIRLLPADDDECDDWDAPSGGGSSGRADEQFNSQIEAENTADLIEEVRERIAKLRQRGIAEHILEQLIHPDDRLSRLVITKDYRLLLPDYNNMEVKMEPLAKAVYLLFLRHPEGILFKHLPDYREEFAEIYQGLRATGLNERALQSIEDVTNPTLNSINEKCARIRGAFVGLFDNHMARHYYIDGLRGEAKKISLPRELVDWE